MDQEDALSWALRQGGSFGRGPEISSLEGCGAGWRPLHFKGRGGRGANSVSQVASQPGEGRQLRAEHLASIMFLIQQYFYFPKDFLSFSRHSL